MNTMLCGFSTQTSYKKVIFKKDAKATRIPPKKATFLSILCIVTRYKNVLDLEYNSRFLKMYSKSS